MERLEMRQQSGSAASSQLRCRIDCSQVPAHVADRILLGKGMRPFSELPALGGWRKGGRQLRWWLSSAQPRAKLPTHYHARFLERSLGPPRRDVRAALQHAAGDVKHAWARTAPILQGKRVAQA
eukprot:3347050-Prymnesium_polylepis.1